MEELMFKVGSSVDKTAALRALLTWVDLGVLKEEASNTFKLLEVAEAAVAGDREQRAGKNLLGIISFISLSNLPVTNAALSFTSAPSIQQQQAEQMKVYWKVCACFRYLSLFYAESFDSSLSKACLQTWVPSLLTGYKRCSSLHPAMTKQLNNWACLWRQLVWKDSYSCVTGCGN